MATAPKRSQKLQEKIDRTRAEAHKRVVERGIMQFRADEEVMDALLRLADYKRVPAGVMVRAWVVERLRVEAREIGVELS